MLCKLLFVILCSTWEEASTSQSTLPCVIPLMMNLLRIRALAINCKWLYTSDSHLDLFIFLITNHGRNCFASFTIVVVFYCSVAYSHCYILHRLD